MFSLQILYVRVTRPPPNIVHQFNMLNWCTMLGGGLGPSRCPSSTPRTSSTPARVPVVPHTSLNICVGARVRIGQDIDTFEGKWTKNRHFC
jgi:hypothetical protein